MSDKIAYTYEEAAQAVGYSKRTIQLAVDRGDLIARYANAKPVIAASELLRWIESLPTEAPKRGGA
jgi:hypothetical protein